MICDRVGHWLPSLTWSREIWLVAAIAGYSQTLCAVRLKSLRFSQTQTGKCWCVIAIARCQWRTSELSSLYRRNSAMAHWRPPLTTTSRRWLCSSQWWSTYVQSSLSSTSNWKAANRWTGQSSQRWSRPLTIRYADDWRKFPQGITHAVSTKSALQCML